MKNLHRVPFRVLLAMSLACLTPLPSMANWIPCGTPLSIGTGATSNNRAIADMRLVPDGAGGAFALWSSGYRVYVQRVTQDGTVAPGWPANGLEVCSVPGIFLRTQLFPEGISDGKGGTIVAWKDTRRNHDYVYAQRVNGDGSLAWPDTGVVVSGTRTDDLALAPDGGGGAFLLWSVPSTVDSSWRIEASHLDDLGDVVAGWQPQGTRICPVAVHPVDPTAAPDGAGGAIFAWSEWRAYPAWSIYATRLGSDGSLAAGWPAGGSLMCTAPESRHYLKAVPDGIGGAVMAWEDDRSPITGVDLYAQHVTSSGSLAAGWPATGFPVSEALEDQGDIANGRPPFMGIVPDDAGGAVLVWSDTRNGGYDLYANRITSGGAVAPGWATDGIPLCTASFEQLYPVLCRDEFGGGYFVWFDRRNGTDYDIYASHLTSSGTLPPGWPVDGKVLCALAGDQLPGAVCEDGAGGAITAWEDFRRGDPDHGDIYATRVYFNQVTGGPPAGPRAAALAIVELRPNPSTGALSVTLRVASDRPARLEWLDVNGRRVLERELGSLTPGQHVVRVDETQGLPVGLYFVRLSQDDRWVMSRAVVAR